ncbi:MAG: hypothetical protein LBF19_02180 [Prevotellaceae bacterium]|jgi:hypothetical protein|nr:hypothetical protein [Prevotellaceae bacterium]
MIRKLIICLLLQPLFIIYAAGQPSYKKVYESIQTMKDYEAFQTLFAYQSATTSKDFVNVNGYYQMGLVAKKMMRHYDPFLQSQNTAQCLADAKTYLSLALHYFTPKEARTNGQYYQATPGERTYENIRQDIQNHLDDVLEYKKYFEQNLQYLTQCTHKYNACIETFGRINRQNARLNDLYFLANNVLKQDLAALQTDFESTLENIEKLKASLEAYPMGDYKINYSLAPVSVYRLHGLVSANFIAKDAVLWDFTSWISAFRNVLDEEVAFLYKQVDEVHKTNLAHIARLKRADKSGVPADYAVNPALLNKIYQYDFNAVTAPLLKYQEDKVRFLYHNADNVTDKHLYTVNHFARSNSYYYELIRKKQQLDSTLRLTEARAMPEAVAKYSAFFASNYKGMAGFKTYLESEAKNNNNLLRTALDAYKNNVWNAFLTDEVRIVQYRGESLFAAVVLPGRVGKQGYFIHSKTVLANKKIFIAGSYAKSPDEMPAFAALLNSEASEVEWLTVFDKRDGKNHGVLTAGADNGLAVVVTTIVKNAEGKDELNNTIYLLDGSGNVKKNARLSATAVPRKLLYDDIGETFLIAFKGATFAPYALSPDALQLCKLKTDLSVDWSRELSFIGYVSNIIKTNDRFYLYGAYNTLTDAAGQRISAGDNKIGAFAYTLNPDGQWQALKRFETTFSYYPLWVSKINNEYADMIAVRASNDGFLEESNRSFYMIISADNEVVYQY